MKFNLHPKFEITDEHPSCSLKRPVLLIDRRRRRNRVVFPWMEHKYPKALAYGPTGADMVARALLWCRSNVKRDMFVRYLEMDGAKFKGLDHYITRQAISMSKGMSRHLSALAYTIGVSRHDIIAYCLDRGAQEIRELIGNERFIEKKPPEIAKEPHHIATETGQKVKALCLDFDKQG